MTKFEEPVVRREWRDLEEKFNSTGFDNEASRNPVGDEDDDDYECIEMPPKPNDWDFPFENMNPVLIQILLQLNKRVEELEDKIVEKEKP